MSMNYAREIEQLKRKIAILTEFKHPMGYDLSKMTLNQIIELGFAKTASEATDLKFRYSKLHDKLEREGFFGTNTGSAKEVAKEKIPKKNFEKSEDY